MSSATVEIALEKALNFKCKRFQQSAKSSIQTPNWFYASA
jgi:hypothetical protein